MVKAMLPEDFLIDKLVLDEKKVEKLSIREPVRRPVMAVYADAVLISGKNIVISRG